MGFELYSSVITYYFYFDFTFKSVTDIYIVVSNFIVVFPKVHESLDGVIKSPDAAYSNIYLVFNLRNVYF